MACFLLNPLKSAVMWGHNKGCLSIFVNTYLIIDITILFIIVEKKISQTVTMFTLWFKNICDKIFFFTNFDFYFYFACLNWKTLTYVDTCLLESLNGT